MHYLRLWRHGTTDDPRPSTLDLFWAKVDTTAGPDGCWPWLGTRNGAGYGRFKVAGRKIYAHRYAYETFVGQVPGDRPQIDHQCNSTSCVNPSHLQPATARANTLRGNAVTAKNARKTHCPAGHPYSGANLYVKPTGNRTCRACRKDSDARRRARQATSPRDS